MIRLTDQVKSQIPRIQTKKFWSSVFICQLCFGIWISPVYASDKIVAIVNNDAITQKDLDDFVNFMRIQLSRQYNKESALEEKMQSLQVDLLDKLIEDKLILQEAKKNNIRVEEARIKARIDQLKRRYNSDTEFQADLAKQGLVQADIEAKIREQMLIYNIVEVKIKDKIIVRPEEVTEVYHKNMKEFISGEERELEVATFQDDSSANFFVLGLKRGENLAELSAKYQVTINRLKVSDREDLRPQIRDTVFKLGIDEVAGPIKIEGRYYVFKLNNITAPRQQPLSAVQDTIHSALFEKKMQEGLEKWLAELKKHSYVKIMR